jgi:hypothetical protein
MIPFHRTFTLARAAAIALCSLWLAVCVPTFLNWKGAGPGVEKRTGSQQKPSTATAEASAPSGDATPEGAKKGEPSPKSVRTSAQPGTDRGERPSPSKEDSSVNERGKRDSGRPGPQPTRTPGTEASSDADSDSEKELAAKKLIKKHDHAAYLETIKQQAMELASKDRSCDYARICRNPITDDWALTMYYREGKFFSFVTYAWDQIDEKWARVFASEKRPVAQWESHVKFTSAGKNCVPIKDSRR